MVELRPYVAIGEYVVLVVADNHVSLINDVSTLLRHIVLLGYVFFGLMTLAQIHTTRSLWSQE